MPLIKELLSDLIMYNVISSRERVQERQPEGGKVDEMREFRIYGEIGANPDTLNFRKFMKEVEERINADAEIIERAKKCNQGFADKIKEMLSNSENDIYLGAMIAGLQFKTPRYSYIKHLEFDGKEYEAEIDELERKFYLHEV